MSASARLQHFRPALVGLITALLFVPGRAESQTGSQNADTRITLRSGDTVTLLTRFMHDNGPALKPPGRRLDLVYSTLIPPTDSLGRMAQADRAAEFFGPQAIELGVRRLSIGICDTRACVERKDPPASWYLYERTSAGWRRAK